MHCQTVTFSSVWPISSPSPSNPKFCLPELSRCSLQQRFCLRHHLHKIHILKQHSQHVRDYISILSYLMAYCLSAASVFFSRINPTNTFTSHSISQHATVLPGFVIHVNFLRHKLPVFYLLIAVQQKFLWLLSFLPRFLLYLWILCCVFYHLSPSKRR